MQSTPYFNYGSSHPPITHHREELRPPHPFTRPPYLGDAVLMGDHAHNVVQGQQGVALDLGVDVLALGADGQQLHQVDVVHQGAVLVHAAALRAHHLHQRLEGGAVVVEHQHVLARVHQLREGSDKELEPGGCVTRGRGTQRLCWRMDNASIE